MSELLTLTQGQQDAYEAFCRFINDPTASEFVLEGYSGTGKSTLVHTLLDRLPKLLKTLKLIDPTRTQRWDVELTATTNKAAEAFSQITGQDVSTIHSKLGLRVVKDYITGQTRLIRKSNAETLTDTILFVDEASYIDRNLLKLILQSTPGCKVVFIGDPAQLLTVGSNYAPVFKAGFTTARLTKVVRQAEGNPIIDLATAFRGTVNEGAFFKFIPDGTHIQVLSREDFEQAIVKEFDDLTWTHNRSKVLAWTNKKVIAYNHGIRDIVKGAPDFQVGDYAVCNHYVSAGKYGIKTDQLVHITSIGSPMNSHGVPGRMYTLDHTNQVFMPDSMDDKKALIKRATKAEDYTTVKETEKWIDLRAAYSCTINKSQGSTYDKVFIDLDDIKKCNSGDQIARMLYVAVSRARYTVYLCGDLV